MDSTGNEPVWPKPRSGGIVKGTKFPRIACPVCGREVRVYKSGKVQPHYRVAKSDKWWEDEWGPRGAAKQQGFCDGVVPKF